MRNKGHKCHSKKPKSKIAEVGIKTTKRQKVKEVNKVQEVAMNITLEVLK